jgi:hypothetical protein
VTVRLKRAAAMLDIAPRTLWALARSGEVPSIKLADRVRLFLVDDLRAWARSRAETVSKSTPTQTQP